MTTPPRSRFLVQPGLIAGVITVEAETTFCFARHTHDDFGIGLIDSGAQVSASGRGPVEAGPGNVITVNPGEVHDGRPIGDAGRRWRMLYLDPALMRDSSGDVSEGAAGDVEFSDPVIVDVRMAGALASLFAVLQGDSHAAMEAEAHLLAFVARLTLRRPSATAGTATPARQRIDDDPAPNVTLAMLAADAGLSRFQLLRAFFRETGLTPHAYLVQKRLGLARRLILRGTPLAEAAAASGFADQSHMTRLFARSFGFTPGRLAPPAISFKTTGLAI